MDSPSNVWLRTLFRLEGPLTIFKAIKMCLNPILGSLIGVSCGASLVVDVEV